MPDHPLVRETVRDCLVEAMDAAGLARGAGGDRRRTRADDRARAPRAVGVRPRDPERQPLRLPRRRAAGRAPHPRGQRAARAAGDGRRADRRARSRGRRRGGRRDRGRARAIPTSSTIYCSTPAPCPRRWAAPAASAICSRRSSGRDAPPASTAIRSCGSPRSAARWPAPSGRRAGSSQTSSSRPRAARRPGPIARARSSRSCAAIFRFHGPTTPERIAAPLGLAASDVEAALAQIELAGAVLRGRFLPELGRRRPVVRAPTAGANQPTHARRPAPRDRAGHRRRLPAFSVRLAERPPGDAAARSARAGAR